MNGLMPSWKNTSISSLLIIGLLLPITNIIQAKSDVDNSISDMVFNADFDEQILQFMEEGHIRKRP